MSKARAKTEYIVSKRLPEYGLIETVTLPDGSTALAAMRDSNIAVVEKVEADGVAYRPIPATNNLLRHRVVLLPPPPTALGDADDLVGEVAAFIARYVTFSDAFITVAAHYVLLSWVYAAFRELPYLRVRGDYGTGKTRALQVIGHLLYKPVFASGATTVSPIFHTLDLFRGSLVLDEADFRFSDQTAELTKILNNGNAEGFPVLRSVLNEKKLYDPRAFAVYGPKLIAMREYWRDEALESRCLTETMGTVPPGGGVPVTLPPEFEIEATKLRGKLLSYRFAKLPVLLATPHSHDAGLSPRANQLLSSLLSCAANDDDRGTIIAYASERERERLSASAFKPESYVLTAIAALHASKAGNVPLTEVRRYLTRHHCGEFDRPITARYLGHLVRARLNLPTRKSHGTFKVLVSAERLDVLTRRFGVDKVDVGDIADGTDE
jgi:hypothetical protein